LALGQSETMNSNEICGRVKVSSPVEKLVSASLRQGRRGRKHERLFGLSAPMPKSRASHRLPIRWDALPHQELYQRAITSIGLGSRERANQDSLKYLLKRRLSELDPGDHRRYVEIGCQRIVETLRKVRDEYRGYLEKEGCKPIAEMYWVVFRFGVIRYAVRLLREVASEYVNHTEVPYTEWEILYGNCFLPVFPLARVPLARDPTVPDSMPALPKNPLPETVKDVIDGLVREQTFERVLVGGLNL